MKGIPGTRRESTPLGSIADEDRCATFQPHACGGDTSLALLGALVLLAIGVLAAWNLAAALL